MAQWHEVLAVAEGCPGAQGRPLMQSRHAAGAHAGAVWQLQWVDRGSAGEELLVSAAADGRIAQWTTRQARGRYTYLSHILSPAVSLPCCCELRHAHATNVSCACGEMGILHEVHTGI